MLLQVMRVGGLRLAEGAAMAAAASSNLPQK